MIKMNNAMLDVFYNPESTLSRCGAYLVKGTMPTKAELNEFLSESDVKTLQHWKTFLTAREGATLVGQLVVEREVDCSFRDRNVVTLPFAGDPAEMEILNKGGIPTWAIVHVCNKSATQQDMMYDGWSGDVAIFTAICNVGDIGSGMDIEIVDGEIVDGNTYKLSNLHINIGEQ